MSCIPVTALFKARVFDKMNATFALNYLCYFFLAVSFKRKKNVMQNIFF